MHGANGEPKEEESSEGTVDTTKETHLEDINRAQLDTDDDPLDNLPDSHPSPKPGKE